MSIKQILLLPGLDGTGKLFGKLLAALPDTVSTVTVAYPSDAFLSYGELISLVAQARPGREPFVLLAESFSTPLAIGYAATEPPNLEALIICAGFVSSPLGFAARISMPFVRPWAFRLRPPRFLIRHLLAGRDAPPVLIGEIGEILQSVRPEVLSGRLREVLKCDARQALGTLRIPVLYLKAEGDKLVRTSCLRDILRIKPDILFATVSAPHMLLQREPVKAAEIIANFLHTLQKRES